MVRLEKLYAKYVYAVLCLWEYGEQPVKVVVYKTNKSGLIPLLSFSSISYHVTMISTQVGLCNQWRGGGISPAVELFRLQVLGLARANPVTVKGYFTTVLAQRRNSSGLRIGVRIVTCKNIYPWNDIILCDMHTMLPNESIK